MAAGPESCAGLHPGRRRRGLRRRPLPDLCRAARARPGARSSHPAAGCSRATTTCWRCTATRAAQLGQAARVRAEVRRLAAVRAPHQQPGVQRPAAAHARAPAARRRAQPAGHRAHGSRRGGAGRRPDRPHAGPGRAGPDRGLRRAHSGGGDRQPARRAAAERAPLRDWSLAILSALEPAPAADVLARGNAAVEDFKAYLRDAGGRAPPPPGRPASSTC